VVWSSGFISACVYWTLSVVRSNPAKAWYAATIRLPTLCPLLTLKIIIKKRKNVEKVSTSIAAQHSTATSQSSSSAAASSSSAKQANTSASTSSGNRNSGSGSGSGNGADSDGKSPPQIYPWMKRVHLGQSKSNFSNGFRRPVLTYDFAS
jgi:hypothetical protein